MAGPLPPPRFVRLAIAASPERTRRAIQTAVRLAASLERELTVTFVRDEDLLRAAALPCTVEVGMFAGGTRPFEVPDVDRLLRREAAAVEHMIARAAHDLGFAWTFTVAQGRMFDLSILRADAGEIVVVGDRAIEPGAETANARVLVLAADGVTALHGIRSIARTIDPGTRITAWIPAADHEAVRLVQAGTADLARSPARTPVPTVRTDALSPEALRRVMREVRPTLVVSPRGLAGDIVAEFMAILKRQPGTLVVMP